MLETINNTLDLNRFISATGATTPELIDKLAERKVIISVKMARLISKITKPD